MKTQLTEKIIRLLDENEVSYRQVSHEPTKTSEESARVRGTPLEQGAKAIVFEADKKHLLLVLPANYRINIKAFKTSYGIKNLRMVSPEEVTALTGVEIGAVPPFGNLMGLPTYVDSLLFEQASIAFNAGSRTVSIIMSSQEFFRLVKPVVGHFGQE